jgi:hypothetical protein
MLMKVLIRIKTVIFKQTHDITDNAQSDSVDKIIETCRTYTRNEPQAQGVMIFMVNKAYNLKNDTIQISKLIVKTFLKYSTKILED